MAATRETNRTGPSTYLERALVTAGLIAIAGLDEAGRGALAGPVVAGAVVLPLEDKNLADALAGVRDSKQMTPAARQRAYERITAVARSWAIGSASPAEVDEYGLIAATRGAMTRALKSLQLSYDYLLIDHLLLPEEDCPQTALVRGDAHCLSIAAASVLAKVSRDRQMVALEHEYPGYGLASHKGYGTAEHRQALRQLGPAPIHRRTYAPVAAVLT